MSAFNQSGQQVGVQVNTSRPAGKYYLWCKQAHGCDYTISCGEVLREIEGASNMIDAQRKANGLLQEIGFGRGDMTLEFASVLEVTDERKFDVRMLESDWAIRNRVRAQEEEHIRDEAEFERLRQKLQK